MNTKFHRLNSDWNADPNDPNVGIRVAGQDLLVTFFVNAYQYSAFSEGESATLRFPGCWRYRFGGTNDEGWYLGQCRFSHLAPKWGEFYEIKGDLRLSVSQDWIVLGPPTPNSRHFLFYFRDETFECDAVGWSVEFHGKNPKSGHSA